MSEVKSNDSRFDLIEKVSELRKENQALREKLNNYEDKIYHATRKIEEIELSLEHIKELHRMQLVAISSATFANTKESLELVENCADEYKSVAFNGVVNSIKREINLIEKLKIAVESLEEINKEEINNQRPGGYYSRSAQLSFKALEKIKESK